MSVCIKFGGREGFWGLGWVHASPLMAKERSGCVNQNPEWFQSTLTQLLRNPSGFSGFSCTFLSAFAAPQAFAPAQKWPHRSCFTLSVRALGSARAAPLPGALICWESPGQGSLPDLPKSRSCTSLFPAELWGAAPVLSVFFRERPFPDTGMSQHSPEAGQAEHPSLLMAESGTAQD